MDCAVGVEESEIPVAALNSVFCLSFLLVCENLLLLLLFSEEVAKSRVVVVVVVDDIIFSSPQSIAS